MRNISHKPPSLRTAKAAAVLQVPPEGVILTRERRLEKGDALEIARIAGILAAKRTWELLPLCHQLPLTHAEISFELREAEIAIEATVETLSGTGVEMEALTAASIAGLTLYDLLKPHVGQDMQLTGVTLLQKTGGKSNFKRRLDTPAKAVVLGINRTRPATIEAVTAQLAELGLEICASESLSGEQLPARLQHWLAQGVSMIATTGGTGIAQDDVAVAAVQPLLDKELPGIMEAARSYGQARTPYALMSAGVAGLSGRTLIMTLPGNVRGANETLAAVSTGLVHLLEGLRR